MFFLNDFRYDEAFSTLKGSNRTILDMYLLEQLFRYWCIRHISSYREMLNVPSSIFSKLVAERTKPAQTMDLALREPEKGTHCVVSLFWLVGGGRSTWILESIFE